MTARLSQPIARLLQSSRTGALPRLRASTIRSSTKTHTQTRNIGQRFNYNRFQSTTGLLRQWAASPNFLYQVAGIAAVGGGFYIANLETVPMSGRRRFNFISKEYVQRTSDEAYQSILQEEGDAILPEWHPAQRQVERVLNRLIPHTGIPSDEVSWKVHVVKSDEENAFIIPGGRVFVYTGLLPIVQDDDGLAVVLGHELAHNVANHMGEKISSGGVVMLIGYLVSFALGLGDSGVTRVALDLAFNNPNSRTQESEADFIGLQIMSEACFDPKAAIGVWERMGKAGRGREPPQILSTHPNSANRLQKFQQWLPAAEMKREASGCPLLSSHAHDFHQAFARWGQQENERYS